MRILAFIYAILLPVSVFCDVYTKADLLGQKHVLRYWDQLSLDEKSELEQQITELDSDVYFALRNLVHENENSTLKEFTAFEDFVIRESSNHPLKGLSKNARLGAKLIAEGRVGCLIVAGGQGSRLGSLSPKGCYPVTNIKDKSLFRLYAEKILAAGHLAERPLSLAIMTSTGNDFETRNYFKENNNFGLSSDQLSFFIQENLPFLDAAGDLFLETPSKIACGPNGNAPALKSFVNSGIWKRWYKEGVRYVIFLNVDNPLADPFDRELIGFHHLEKTDVAIKCIARCDPKEKLGVIVSCNGKPSVVEYSEITSEERDAKTADGKLKHLVANVGMFSFGMDFIQDAALKHYKKLPYHKAWKSTTYLSDEGISQKNMAWKFEKFIFDYLPFASTVSVILYPREECFAPLKNATGPDNIEDVKLALLRYDRILFSKITGEKVPNDILFELDPAFYYPTKELLEKWKGCALPQAGGYIDP